MENKTLTKTIEENARFIIISLLFVLILVVIAGFSWVLGMMITKKEVQEIVSTEMDNQFTIQELKGNVWTDF